MKLPGIITNVTAFGAFVDIGVHQDGLIHISELAESFIKHPHEVVKVHQRVTVTVLDVDLDRRRISLSMRKVAARSSQEADKNPSREKNRRKKGRQEKQDPEPFNNPFAQVLKK